MAIDTRAAVVQSQGQRGGGKETLYDGREQIFRHEGRKEVF